MHRGLWRNLPCACLQRFPRCQRAPQPCRRCPLQKVRSSAPSNTAGCRFSFAGSSPRGSAAQHTRKESVSRTDLERRPGQNQQLAIATEKSLAQPQTCGFVPWMDAAMASVVFAILPSSLGGVGATSPTSTVPSQPTMGVVLPELPVIATDRRSFSAQVSLPATLFTAPTFLIMHSCTISNKHHHHPQPSQTVTLRPGLPEVLRQVLSG